MFKTVVTLFRGSVAAAGEELEDRTALLILDQQMRDAAAAVERSKRTLALAIAQASQGVLRLRQRGFVGASCLDAAAAERAHRLGGAGDPAAAIELGDAGLRVRDVPLQADNLCREQRPRRQRRVAVGLEACDGFGGLLGEILAAAIERRNRAGLEIGDAGDGGLELAALLLVLRDRQIEAQAADDALVELDAATGPLATAEKLAEQGFGPRLKTTADDVLARLKSKRTPTA